jgi:hypothetical protein
MAGQLFVRAVGAAAAVTLISLGASTPAGGKDAASADESQAATRARIGANFARLPLSFERNAGQTDDQVRFLSRGRGYTLFLTGNEAVLALRKGDNRQETKASRKADGGGNNRSDSPAPSPQSLVPSVLRMKLAGANPDPQVTGLDELPGKSNYFIGNDPKKWRTNVPTYAKVRYEEVYPGIDVVYYGNGPHPQPLSPRERVARRAG